MSRSIDLSKPLSESDVKYLAQRDRLPADYQSEEVETDPETSSDDSGEGQGSEGSGDGEGEDKGDGEGEYEDLTNDELKALLRAKDLPVSGNRAELIERLTA